MIRLENVQVTFNAGTVNAVRALRAISLTLGDGTAAGMTVEQNLSLATLMVTHNMQQALRVGTRTIMLDQGEIALDVSEEERRGMTVDDLVKRFHETHQRALVDDELLLTS